MCGIAGIVSPSGANREIVRNMRDAINHRGPDDRGFWTSEKCALAHSRLSIVDVGGGHQPMCSENGKTAIVFNGEVYGYRKIRQEIPFKYRTDSDTEVVLALYHKYGIDMLQRLPGMFAFAIWDEEKQMLFAARDRFGEKPFYFTNSSDGKMIFASEIKGILQSKEVGRVVNKESASFFLKHLFVHPASTIFDQIKVLPPAHFLIWQAGTVKVERYWSLPHIQNEITRKEAIEQLDYLLADSVKKQLVADVPVGAFLSAGVDSGTIVSYAAKTHENIDTFSFGFKEGNNELAGAKSVAKRYKTNHHEFLDCDFSIIELLKKMHQIYDEPFADSSNIPTYLISKFASESLKVVLSGDGGDELFGGYDFWYNKLTNVHPYPSKSILSFPYINAIERGFSNLSRKVQKYYSDEIAIFKSWNSGNLITKTHKESNTYFNNEELESLGLESVRDKWYSLDKYNSSTPDDAFRMDIECYLPGDILTKTDRASMANGLELRSPFLDVDLAQYCIALPWNLKIDEKESKILLKELAQTKIPANNIQMTKTGFGAPVNYWLANLEIQEMIKDLTGKKKELKISSFVDVDSKLFDLSAPNYRTWILLNLILWGESWL